MLNLPASTQIYLAAEPIDIRKGFDALAGWVQANGLDVYRPTDGSNTVWRVDSSGHPNITRREGWGEIRVGEWILLMGR